MCERMALPLIKRVLTLVTYFTQIGEKH